MLVQFTVVSDNSAWMVDTMRMSYVHSESQADDAKIIERGKIIFVGLQGPLRVFALEGRTPKTDGPGAGLCSFGYALIDLDNIVTFFIQANVPTKDLNSRRPVDTIRYELIPTGENNGTTKQEEPSRPQKSPEPGELSAGPEEDKQPAPEASVSTGD